MANDFNAFEVGKYNAFTAESFDIDPVLWEKVNNSESFEEIFKLLDAASAPGTQQTN